MAQKYAVVSGKSSVVERAQPIAIHPNPMNASGLTVSKPVMMRKEQHLAVKMPAKCVYKDLGPYVQNNPAIYDAAFMGFIGGAFFKKYVTAANVADGTSIRTQGVLFAQAVDSGIATDTVSDQQAALVQSLSQAVMADKYSTGLPQSAFETIAGGIIACYNDTKDSLAPVPQPGGGGPWVQDVSAGGTVVYDGPTLVPSTIYLTGTPPAGPDVTYVLPVGCTTTVGNQSTGSIDLATALQPASVFLGAFEGYSTSATVFANSSGYVIPVSLFSGDVQQYGENGFSATGVAFLGSVNGTIPNATPNIPIYGAALCPLDAATYGITILPSFGQPGNAPGGGCEVWYTSGLDPQGWVAQDSSGYFTVIAPRVWYPQAPWNTQLMMAGALGPNLGGTLTGPNVTATLNPVLATGTQFNTTHAEIVIQCRIVSSTGLTETAGDIYTVVIQGEYVHINSVLRWVPMNQIGPVVVDQATGLTMIAITSEITVNDLGNAPQITVTTPAAFDVSTVMDIAIHLRSLSL